MRRGRFESDRPVRAVDQVILGGALRLETEEGVNAGSIHNWKHQPIHVR